MTPNRKRLNELALFAGAGGGILGGKILGWRTVCAVEWDGYARDVLVARQNDGCLEAFPIWDDVQTFDGRPWRGAVDVVSGGFPCQDISVAGKGAGIDGERSGMWKHMARIISEVLPRFVFVENSPMLVGRGLGTVLTDLAEMGYDAAWGIVGARDVSAPHKRERIWIRGELADAGCAGRATRRAGSGQAKDGEIQHMRTANGCASVENSVGSRTGSICEAIGADRGRDTGRHESALRQAHGANGSNRTGTASEAPANVADSASSQDHGIGGDCECGRVAVGRQEQATQQDLGSPDHDRACGCRGAWWGSDPAEWPTESRVGRVAHGVACRVDRLRCIGNGQVPAVVPLAWNLLKPMNPMTKPMMKQPESPAENDQAQTQRDYDKRS